MKTRGRFRLETCLVLPVMINLSKKALEGTLFDGEDKIKLVVP